MIKYGSNSHHILLMLQSAKKAPKSVPNLCFISSKPKWKVERALDVLTRHGLVRPESRTTYWITPKGSEALVELAKGQGRNMKDDDNIVVMYQQTKIRQAARKRERSTTS